MTICQKYIVKSVMENQTKGVGEWLELWKQGGLRRLEGHVRSNKDACNV